MPARARLHRGGITSRAWRVVTISPAQGGGQLQAVFKLYGGERAVL